MNRPQSPNSQFEDAKTGGDLIQKDWQMTKLKKRVDANEDGIDKLNDLIQQMAKQINDIQQNQNNLEDKFGFDYAFVYRCFKIYVQILIKSNKMIQLTIYKMLNKD